MRTLRHRGTGLLVQTSAAIHNSPVIDRCIVPTGDGPCGYPLYEGGSRSEFDNHVAGCARRHSNEILAERQRQHPEVMRPWDPELEKWISDNRDALLEDRKRI